MLQGGITASMAGGSFCGALASNLTADRLGRRDSMAYACVIYIAGCAIMCSAQNVAQLIVSRIVNGFAVGILSSQACATPGRSLLALFLFQDAKCDHRYI